MRCKLTLLLIVLVGLLAGCGSGDSSSGGATSGSTGATTSLPTTQTLRVVLDFAPSQRALLGRLPDTVTGYVVQVFTPAGQLLASQSGTRVPGSGSVTVTFAGLPLGPVVVRLTCTDGGNLVGSQDLGTVLGDVPATLTFDTLTGGPTPSPGASPTPSPGASPSPAVSPTTPSGSPQASPTPAGSPQSSPAPAASPQLVSLALQPAPAGGPLTLLVGNSQALQVVGSFSDGTQQNLTAQATLISSNPVGVSVQGALAQALSPGLVTVTAQLGSLQASLEVLAFVNPPPFTPASGPVAPPASGPAPPAGPAPTVTGLSAVAGPLAGGTVFTITGTNFTAGSTVRFGATPATTFTINSPTQITATAPGPGAGPVDVIVTNSNGSSATGSADLFTYQGPPTVTGLSPSFGPVGGGTLVTLTGTNFLAASGVSFGGTAATAFAVVSATQITATAPANARGAVDVVVTTSSGSSPTSGADQFTYQDLPTVTGISPSVGPFTGGTVVTITGTDLLAASVSFGGTLVAPTIVTATQLTATAPAHAAGTIDVVVTTSGGTSATSSADRFTYVGLPAVTGLSLTTGPLQGKNKVVVTGSGFLAGATVNFGAVAATGVSVDSATQITCTAPAQPAGLVDVVVTTLSGSSGTGTADQYTYDFLLYVTDGNNKNVSKVDSAGTITPFVTGLTTPRGLAFDSARNLYVADVTQVVKVTPAGAKTTFASGFTNLEGLAVDSLDNVYVADSAAGVISQVTPGGAKSTFLSFPNAIGLAFDGADNLYVTNGGPDVTVVTPAASASVFSTGYSTLFFLALDSGNLYVTDFNNNSGGFVYQQPPLPGTRQLLENGLTPTGVAVDTAGNVYVGNPTQNRVDKVPAGGSAAPFASGFGFFPVGLAF